MRRFALTALCLALCLALGGCSGAGEVENHAFALVMGVDRSEDGGIALTIRIPRISGGSAEGEGAGDGGEPYLTVSARGADYAQALERLQWAAARELNLSQLKLLIVSEALASSDGFGELVSRIAETRHLYTTAGFVVCDGDAGEFVGEQRALLGTRLSSEINAMFRHYADRGYIPRATLAEFYYALGTDGSDPTGIWAYVAPDEPADGASPAGAVVSPDSGGPIAGVSNGASQRYLGAAVFRDGRLALRLNAAETLWQNLLSGKVGSFGYRFGDRTWALGSLAGPRYRVRVDGDGVEIEADVYLSAEERVPPELVAPIRADIADHLHALVRRCQDNGVEPFGFSRKAALGFWTVDRWRAFDWHSRFQQAQVRVNVHLVNAPE